MFEKFLGCWRNSKKKNRPEWLIYENVKGMLSSNRGLDYLSIVCEMDRLGYDIEWQNINSKWWVPQNRERIYTIGHLRRYGPSKIFPVTGTDGKNSIYQVGMLKSKRKNPNQGRVYKSDGISPCLNKMDGGGREPSVILPYFINMNDGILIKIKEAKKCGYSEAHFGDSINLSVPNSKTRRERVCKSIAQTLDTSCNQGIFAQVSDELTVYAIWYEEYQCYISIRKLTPKECFRLQGWSDDYFEKAAFVNSDSQLYKQAGNGVTVNVVEAIGRKINK